MIILCSVAPSLKNHGVEDSTEDMFGMGAETMALPMKEKMAFEQGDSGRSFGYAYVHTARVLSANVL